MGDDARSPEERAAEEKAYIRTLLLCGYTPTEAVEIVMRPPLDEGDPLGGAT